jgi:hypothetical protein
MGSKKSNDDTPRFVGSLNDPIIRTDPLALALITYKQDEEEKRATHEREADRLWNERVTKMMLLLGHYGIDFSSDSPWMTLSFCLARDFVPGMTILDRPPRKKGRPSKWRGAAPSNSLSLVHTVEAIQQERQKGILDAVRIAIKRFPDRWRGYDAKTLVTRYHEARKLNANPFALDYFLARQNGSTKSRA